MLQSATPAIVVPHAHGAATLAERPLVAWNGSLPAARALKAALPLLRGAERVDVVSWSRRASGAPFSGLGPAAWLERHGVRATMHERPPTAHVADALRGFARELASDLVVMGCYGHSRMREQMFGGVTRGLLAALPVPVLMAH